MPRLNIPRNYANSQPLRKSNLDDAFNSIETLLNTTLLDEENLDLDTIFANLTAAQANNILGNANSTGIDNLLSNVSSSQANDIFSGSTFSSDTSNDTDSRTVSTSELTTCSITSSNTGLYLIIAQARGGTSGGDITARIKVNSSTVKTQTIGDSVGSFVSVQTVSSGVDVDLTLQRASGSGTAESELTLVRIT